jgi:hypothetical protein
MPVQTLSVRFGNITVLDDSDKWGAGEWHLYASVNGQTIGNPETEFVVRTGDFFDPPREDWTRVVDVSGHHDGDKIEIKFRIKEKDVFSWDDLGEVTATVKHPYPYPFQMIHLETRFYRVWIFVKHVDEVASTNPTGATRIPVTRDKRGGAAFSTVRGEIFTPRVDIHAVIPVPQPPSHVPRPVNIPAGLAAAAVLPASDIAAAPSAPPLNVLLNPCVIPILNHTDADFANRVAKIAVTAYEPGNLDTRKLFWRVASGPAVISGANTGLAIQAYGQKTGAAGDQMAVFEVRWENANGPLLAIYRAWVGKIGKLKYRVNLLNGRVPAGSPAGATAPFQASLLLTPADANGIMQVVRAIWYQAGIWLIPDDDVTCYECATLTAAGNSIFELTVADNQHTNDVSHEIISSATRYNFNPGVINFAIIFSAHTNNGAAVDRNGLEGSPDTGKQLAKDFKYTYNGSGVKKRLDGSPSSSWIKPAGVGRDGAGIVQTINTINPTDRVKQARKLDKDFIASRQATAAGFTAAKMGELYACQIPARWGNYRPNYIWHCGVNFAHELGHILGLAHRGCAGHKDYSKPGLSADGMNFTNAAGEKWGHPWYENIMTYGYGWKTGLNPPRAHDVDLLQAIVVRRHPAIRYD